MNVIKSLVIAIAMYSRIPVPQFEWKKENMRYSLLFFPVIGIILGGLQYFCFQLGERMRWPDGFLSVLLTAIPILVTGGIHMDGYCDTMDALSSWQPPEKRLTILKDAHVGAFAVIWCALYFLLAYGCWQMVNDPQIMCAICLGYVVSRTGSGLAAVCFPVARKRGSLAAFSDAATKRIVSVGLYLLLTVTIVLQIVLCAEAGIFLFMGQVFFYLYYYKMVKKKFGGITGDLEGWFLQWSELLTLFVLALF